MTALKPCPFCGSTDLEVFANEISCVGCNARGPSQEGPEYATNPHVRDSDWNTREQINGRVVAYVCTGCGRPCRDPDADFAALREAGKLSCCPERNMQPVFFATVPASEDIPFDKAEQAQRCSCLGSDDYCPCQNVADAQTRKDAIRGVR